MPLSQTEVIRYIERRLGYKLMDLEISPDEIIDVIQTETLPEFSKYFPYVQQVLINDADKVEGYDNRWRLRTPGDEEILNINRVIGLDRINNIATGGGDGIVTGNPRMGATMGNPLDNQVMADIYSLQRNPTLFHFYPPNILEITPSYTSASAFQAVVNTVHRKNFSTIPVNLRKQFLQLALIDAADTILPLRTRFQTIQTTFGSVELMIDQLQEISQSREEVTEKFRQSVTRMANRKKVWFG